RARHSSPTRRASDLKWRREYETFLPKADTRTTPENVPILRYTDVLLMYAEAENALNGPTQEVIDIVNSVRWRGWAKGVKTITVRSEEHTSELESREN